MTDSEQLKEIYEHFKNAYEEVCKASEMMPKDDYNVRGLTKFQSQLYNYMTEYENKYGKSLIEKR